jgi:hypothetical protein
MEIAIFTKVFYYLANVANAVLAVALYRRGLHGVYRFLFAFLVFQAIRGIVVYPLNPRSKLYGDVYFVSTVILFALTIGMVVELYGLVLAERQGIASLGRWVVFGALMVSCVASLLIVELDLVGTAGSSPILFYFNVVQRVLTSATMFFLLLLTAFLVWFPVPLKRNVVVYCLGYAVYSLALSTALLLMNVAGLEFARLASAGQLVVASACYVAWLVLLNREGEQEQVVVGHRWNPQKAERLIGQLNAVNAALLRTARR